MNAKNKLMTETSIKVINTIYETYCGFIRKNTEFEPTPKEEFISIMLHNMLLGYKDSIVHNRPVIMAMNMPNDIYIVTAPRKCEKGNLHIYTYFFDSLDKAAEFINTHYEVGEPGEVPNQPNNNDLDFAEFM